MKKSIITLAAGVLIGVSISYAGPAWAAAKQFILNEVNYPVVVDGKVYKDTKAPILNYNGSTYIPLAKIGDLTGVNYKWNSEKKQVEIGTKNSSSDGPAGRKNDNLQPDTEVKIEEPVVKGYKGIRDEADVNIEIAKVHKVSPPPLLSQGWISEDLFYDVFKYNKLYSEDKPGVEIVNIGKNYDVLITFEFPDGWSDADEQKEINVNGVRVKRHLDTNYYNIADFEKKLGIKK
ncbi:stalk domain-containing protein [Paenibacillus pinihumi]|uniref:stalk domain-containing protein n=1 Tax=Paenibacillus pinihumi TaxID=669462 RepID=UPI00040E61B2|nr:stalk domain-containing protein [Paenibacillus pinihumi]